MDMSCFLGDKPSRGLAFIEQAINELDVNVTNETTVLELFGIYNGILARALDIIIEETEKNKPIY